LEPLEELVSHLEGAARAIVIASKDVDLRPASGDNTIFVLKIGEGSLAAGGRGGGFGERRVTDVLCFERKGGSWRKAFQAGEGKSASFEVPYYVSRLPLTMADGKEAMGYGVVDPELVTELSNKAGIPSSA
jgi:hypothetical protein